VGRLRPPAVVDNDGWSCRTLEANSSVLGGAVLQADVTALRGEQLREAAGLDERDPLLIVGERRANPSRRLPTGWIPVTRPRTAEHAPLADVLAGPHR